VSVSEPSEAELESVNPSMLFQIYNKGYTCKYVDSKVINGKTVDIVDIIPTKAKQDIVKITVQIEQKRATLDQIFIKNKAGISQKISIANYKSGIVYPDNVFVFNPKQFPKVEINDLR
jgi:outer membrane lipoprotein carrier protein